MVAEECGFYVVSLATTNSHTALTGFYVAISCHIVTIVSEPAVTMP